MTRKLLFREYDNLEIIEGILYRYSEDHNGQSTTQFVLPVQVVKPIVNQIHSSIFNAHLGKSKTTSKIIERFYRPFLKDEIKNCIKSCDICQRTKQAKNKHLAELLY